MSDDAIKTLVTLAHHRLKVQEALNVVTRDLETRSLVHDASKYQDDEFAGFTRINRTAREHPYGSAEYRASLKQEKPTISLHYARNSHHPEFWGDDSCGGDAHSMRLLDLIEMVCDWWAAWTVYDGQRPVEQRSTWWENIWKQKERFLDTGLLSPAQWFVVQEVARLLGPEKEPSPAP